MKKKLLFGGGILAVLLFLFTRPREVTYEGEHQGYRVHVYVTKNLLKESCLVTIRHGSSLALAEFEGRHCTFSKGAAVERFMSVRHAIEQDRYRVQSAHPLLKWYRKIPARLWLTKAASERSGGLFLRMTR